MNIQDKKKFNMSVFFSYESIITESNSLLEEVRWSSNGGSVGGGRGARIRVPVVVEAEVAASWVENNLCLSVSRDETWFEEQRRASHHLPTNSRTRRLQNLKEIYDSRTIFFFFFIPT